MSAPVKWRRILAALATGERLNRFSAMRMGDSVLPQTIHRIERQGVPVERQMITLPGYHGTVAHVAEYWLGQEGFEKAQKILAAEVGQ